jgi:hypothetical protein
VEYFPIAMGLHCTGRSQSHTPWKPPLKWLVTSKRTITILIVTDTPYWWPDEPKVSAGENNLKNCQSKSNSNNLFKNQ